MEKWGAMAEPLRLLSQDADGKFILGEEALRALSSVKGPVGVVAVCGRARQGKSFILNQLLGRSSGFKVAPTIRPVTKGLWMWSAPVERTLPDGSKYHLVLLDTEGIDAYDQTGQYSTQIFSLAVLLSSMFVYNQMGGIDEAALDRLSLVTEMTKHIRARAGGESSYAELGRFTPSFLWLLRDFYLDLEDEGRAITARDYLETALQPVAGSGTSVSNKNQIRDSIRSLFPDRDCFTLVRPVNDEKELQRLEQIAPSKMRPEFVAGLEGLTQRIFDRARPKMMGDAVLSGPMLGALARSFVDAINEGAVPTISTAWQGVVEGECRVAAEAGEEAYTRAFNPNVAPEESVLIAEHERAANSAVAAFAARAVGEGPLRAEHEARLRARLAARFESHKDKAFAEASLKCSELLAAAAERMQAECSAPSATVDSALALLEDEVTCYELEAAGPAKWERLSRFLRQTLSGCVAPMAARQVAAAEARAEAAEARAERAEEEAGQWRGRAEAAEEGARTAAAEHAANMRAEKDRARADAAEARAAADARAAALSASLEGRENAIRELESSRGGAERRADAQAREMADMRAQLDTWRQRATDAERSARAMEESKVRAEGAALRAEAAERAAGALAAQESAAAAAAAAREAAVRRQLDAKEAAGGAAHEALTSWLREMQEEAARAAPAAAPPAPPAKRRATAAAARQAASAAPAPPEEEDFDGPDENAPNNTVDANQLTVMQLKEALTEAGYAHEFLALGKPKKKDLVELYNLRVRG